MNQAKRAARPHLSALSSAVLESLHPRSATGRRPHRQVIKSSLLSASGTIIVASALAVGPAREVFAQEDVLDEVTVTGSRIRREDFTANAPVLSVDEQMFDQTTSIGVETILNRLPQFTPAVTQFTTADVQQTATNTVGVSTVSLRGLGPNRNLVLINGRRAMPVDPTMVIDTNSIPSSAIQRVEIISGGASAVYGADAVGGVVNFILKDDFEGASVDVRYADTEHGGNEEISISALLGVNAADDRGNIMFGVERSTRSLQRQWERDWRLADFADPSAPGAAFEWGSTPWLRNEVNFSSPVPNVNTNLPIQSAAALAAWKAGGNDPTPLDTATCADCIFSGLPPGTIPNNVNTVNYRLNDDGTFFTGMGFAQDGPTMAPGGYRFNGPLYDPNIPGSGGNHQGEFAGLPVFVAAPNGYIKENNLYAWASSPLERLSSFANGHFDISDSVRVTAQASVSRTQTQSSLGQTAANINQWAAAVPFGNKHLPRQQPAAVPRAGAGPQHLRHSGFADRRERERHCRCRIDRTNAAYTINGRFGVECDAAAYGSHALARRPAGMHDVGGLADQPRGLQPLHEPAGSEPGHLGQPFARLPEDDGRQWPLDDQHDDDDAVLAGSRRRAPERRRRMGRHGVDGPLGQRRESARLGSPLVAEGSVSGPELRARCRVRSESHPQRLRRKQPDLRRRVCPSSTASCRRRTACRSSAQVSRTSGR